MISIGLTALEVHTSTGYGRLYQKGDQLRARLLDRISDRECLTATCVTNSSTTELRNFSTRSRVYSQIGTIPAFHNSMLELLVRFLIGGAIVSTFAVLADVLSPKSFAGLFGAAPSVALATLFLTIGREGAGYAAVEARSMVAGAVAFFIYACAVVWLIQQFKTSARLASTLSLLVWMVVASGLHLVWQ
jgi:uncharacterized membrane protein (GlpM family)